MPDRQRWNEITRRDALKLGTVGSATLIAGCGGSGDQETTAGGGDTTTTGGGGEDTTTTSGGELADESYEVVKARLEPSKANFNIYNPQRQDDQMHAQLFDRLGFLSRNTLEFVGNLAPSWEFGDGTLTLNLAEGRQWHNGEDLVAEDVLTKLKLERALDNPLWNNVTSVSAPDSTTVELSLVENAKERIVLGQLMSHTLYIDTPRFVFGEYLDAIESADSDSAQEEAVNELVGFEWGVDDVVGNGPFALAEATERRYRAEAFRQHPAFDGPVPSANEDLYGDGLDFSTFEQSYWTDENTALQEVLSGGATVIHGAGPDSLKTDPQEGTRIITWPVGAGYAPTFDFEHEVVGRRKFRQAIAYAIDTERVASNTTPVSQGVRKPCGIAEAHYEEGYFGDRTEAAWLPNIADSLQTYERDQERATSLLEEVGFTKDGGTWMWEGEPFELTMKSSNVGAYQLSSQSVVNQLKRFGFNIELQLAEAGQWTNDFNEGNYTMSNALWGPSFSHPYNGFNTMFNTWSNAPDTVEVPMPLGDPEGSLEEMNVGEKLEQLPSASADETETLVEELAWAANQTLPNIPVTSNVVTFIANNETFEFPADDHPITASWYWQYNILKYGLVQTR